MDRKYTMEYYSGIKKNEILPFAAIGMDLEGIMLREMSDRERQIPYDLTYKWNLKKKKRVHEYRNRLVVSRSGGRRQWVKEVKATSFQL